MPFGGPLYLVTAPSFNLPPRLYGNVYARAERVLNTFEQRDNSTGVLNIGRKGSGKTLLSKCIANLAAERHNMPTILVNNPWSPEAFNDMVQKINQPVVLLFDEFEKNFETRNYSDDESSADQEKLLTLLDGVASSKKLFLFTVNDRYKLNNFLINRPGRIFYKFEYDQLDDDIVAEYLEDVLDVQHNHFVDDILKHSKTITDFNFDILQAIVEELNRYGGPLKEVLSTVNIDVADSRCKYDIVVTDKNKKVVFEYKNMTVNPYQFSIPVDVMLMQQQRKKKRDSEGSVNIGLAPVNFAIESENGTEVTFTQHDVTRIDTNGTIVAVKNGYTLTATPVQTNQWYDVAW